MTPREIEQLLGGYATDTLTGEERRTLFEAALGNQALFEALAEEQALKEVLEDPACRAHLLATLGERRSPGWARVVAWMRQPSVLALSGAVAAAVILILAVRPGQVEKPAPAVVASRQAAPAPADSPAPAPAPAPAQAVLEDRSAGAPRKPAVVNKETEADAKAEAKVKSEEQTARPEPSPPPPPARPTAPATVAPPSSNAMPAAAPTPPARAPVAAGRLQGQARDEVRQATGAAAQMEAMKAAPAVGARDLYYAAAPPMGAVNGFTDRSLEKARKKTLSRSGTTSAPGFAAGAVGGAPAALRAPGIRYSILERMADGSTKEVNPAAAVGVGNGIRIRFEGNLEGELSVMRRELGGGWTLWGTAHLRVGEPFYLPAEEFVMAAAGESHFFVRFGRTLRTDTQVANTAGLMREQSGGSVYVVNPVRSAEAGVEFEFIVAAK